MIAHTLVFLLTLLVTPPEIESQPVDVREASTQSEVVFSVTACSSSGGKEISRERDFQYLWEVKLEELPLPQHGEMSFISESPANMRSFHFPFMIFFPILY